MTSSPFDLSKVLSHIAAAAPVLVAAFAGAILCLLRSSRPVRVRIAVACAVAIELGMHLGWPLLVQVVFQRFSPGSDAWETGFMMVRLLGSLSSAAVLGLLLYAAFTRDDPAPDLLAADPASVPAG